MKSNAGQGKPQSAEMMLSIRYSPLSATMSASCLSAKLLMPGACQEVSRSNTAV